MSHNMAVVQIINKQSSKDKIITRLVRRLVLATLECNIHFWAKHLPGKHNVIANCLSRFQFQAAFQSAPQLNRLQTPIPKTSLIISIVCLWHFQTAQGQHIKGHGCCCSRHTHLSIRYIYLLLCYVISFPLRSSMYTHLTVLRHTSAIRYVHKLLGTADPSTTFLAKKVM